jgi:hypothetical protein
MPFSRYTKKYTSSLRNGRSPKQVESSLVEAGIDLGTASLVVQNVVQAQGGAKKGDLGYRIWIKQVIANPFRSGFLVGLVTIITVVFTLVAAFAGVLLFPPGTYPRIVLAAPGIIAGVIFFFVLS